MRFSTSRSPFKCFMTILVAAIGVGSTLRSVLDQSPGVSLENDILTSTRGGDQEVTTGASVRCNSLNRPEGGQGSCLQEYTSCVVCDPDPSSVGSAPASGGNGGWSELPGPICDGIKYLGECTYAYPPDVPPYLYCHITSAQPIGWCDGQLPHMDVQSP